jgi:hypothetical protein
MNQRRRSTVHTAHGVGTPAFDQPFAAWAQFDVHYLDQPRAMQVVQLDRLGLTVVAADDTALPPIGLPRRALIVTGSTELGELRLVVRTATPAERGATALVVQPSRASDHASLWGILRGLLHAGQMQENAAPMQRDTGVAAFPKQASASPLQFCNPRMPSWCDASFTTASRLDAQFFACWLDYHFAEVRAYARIALPVVQLNEIYTRAINGEVETRFVFSRLDDSLATACAEMLCRWIQAEAARHLDMMVEHGLGASSASGCRTHLAA